MAPHLGEQQYVIDWSFQEEHLDSLGHITCRYIDVIYFPPLKHHAETIPKSGTLYFLITPNLSIVHRWIYFRQLYVKTSYHRTLHLTV